MSEACQYSELLDADCLPVCQQPCKLLMARLTLGNVNICTIGTILNTTSIWSDLCVIMTASFVRSLSGLPQLDCDCQGPLIMTCLDLQCHAAGEDLHVVAGVWCGTRLPALMTWALVVLHERTAQSVYKAQLASMRCLGLFCWLRAACRPS